MISITLAILAAYSFFLARVMATYNRRYSSSGVSFAELSSLKNDSLKSLWISTLSYIIYLDAHGMPTVSLLRRSPKDHVDYQVHLYLRIRRAGSPPKLNPHHACHTSKPYLFQFAADCNLAQQTQPLLKFYLYHLLNWLLVQL